MAAAAGNGLGVVADDVDGDGRPDVFVANDGTPNHLWMNRGGMRFAEEALARGVAIDQDGAAKAGMGVHAADVDGDGDNELLVMNLDTESDSYFRNDGRFFVDATSSVGLRTVSRRFTRFGMALADFDNDARLDLYEANGRVGLQGETFAADPYAEPSLLLRGVDGPGFVEVQPRGGTAQPIVRTSRAAAFGDIDNDGGLDVLVANRDQAPTLLHNVVRSARPLAPDRGPRRPRQRRPRCAVDDSRRRQRGAPRRAHRLQLPGRQRSARPRRPRRGHDRRRRRRPLARRRHGALRPVRGRPHRDRTPEPAPRRRRPLFLARQPLMFFSVVGELSSPEPLELPYVGSCPTHRRIGSAQLGHALAAAFFGLSVGRSFSSAGGRRL